jgi:hypothetical protein
MNFCARKSRKDRRATRFRKTYGPPIRSRLLIGGGFSKPSKMWFTVAFVAFSLIDVLVDIGTIRYARL